MVVTPAPLNAKSFTMAVKSKSKAKTTEFEKLVARYTELVNNG